MKKKYIIIAVFISSINFSFIYGQTPYEKAISNIKTVLNCDRDYAEWFIYKINNYAEKVQSDIEYIANSTDEYSIKITRITPIIRKWFKNENSIVEVSSLNHPDYCDQRTIQEYLYNLAKIKQRYNYIRVQLMFVPDYLGIGRFEKRIGENCYELSLTMWQIFTGWSKDGVKYEDATRKKFRLLFYVDDKNRLVDIKAERILVAETIRKNQLKEYIK